MKLLILGHSYVRDLSKFGSEIEVEQNNFAVLMINL